MILTLSTALLGLIVFTASAFASKEAINYFGEFGSAGGQLWQKRDIGVNESGAGGVAPGTVYVADQNNNRVQRFSPSGAFVSAWGADVIQAGKAGDVGGTNPFEICTSAEDCKAGVATGGNGTTAGNGAMASPQSVAVDGDTGNVYVSDRDNGRINEYSATGSFVRSFGWDVVESGPGNTGTEYEVCEQADGDVCKAGVASSTPGAGQFGPVENPSSGAWGIAVSQPDGQASVGKVFLANSGARRVETYDLDGTSPANFGSSAIFGFYQPTKVAVDSRGIVYASNSSGNAQIERYDSENANGGGVGFLAPILASVPGSNESQSIHFENFSFGDLYTLTCPNGETTKPITYINIGSGGIISALSEKCGDGGFSASGSPPDVTIFFGGPFAATNVPPMTCTTVSGAGTCSISDEVDGVPGIPRALLTGETSGLAVAPDSDGPGSDTDNLYVLRARNSITQGKTVVQQFDNSGQATAPTAAADEHGAGGDLELSAEGLGLNEDTGTLYVGNSNRVYILTDPIDPPAAVMNPITVKTDTTATLSGTVDPKGGLVSCRFEYATLSNFADAEEVQEPGCASVDVNGGAQAVSENVTELDPNTTYFVRLSVARPFISGSTVNSGPQTFATDSVPPVVGDVDSVQVGDTSARLVGSIDPRNSETAYVFEYGTTPALGSSTPSVSIGSGTEVITVSQLITGLQKDTTYYFRLVATSDVGSTASAQATLHTRTVPFPPAGSTGCPNEAIRVEQNSRYLSDCRAYEMVSPPDKNQGGVDITVTNDLEMAYANDGNAVAYCTGVLFGDPPPSPGGSCFPYISRRGAGGWTTSYPFPQFCADDHHGFEASFSGSTVFLNGNFDRALIRLPESSFCQFGLLDPDAVNQKENLYALDLTTNPTSAKLVASPSPRAGGGNDDLSRVLLTSLSNLSDPPDSPAPGDFKKIYEWEEEGHGSCTQAGGCYRLQSKDPSNVPFNQETILASPGGTGAGEGFTSLNSPHGLKGLDRTVFFYTGPINEEHLYMREDGTTTYDVSASECTVSCPSNDGRPDLLHWASEDGGTALFSSCDKLTNASAPTVCSSQQGSKIYRWDRDAPPGARLVDLTVDDEPSDGLQAHFLGIFGASDDGSVLYFAANGQIVAGAPTGPETKIFRSEWNEGEPSVEYLGAYAPHQPGILGQDKYLPQSDLSSDPNAPTTGLRKYSRVTPDGEYILLTTPVRMRPAIDRDADIDAYRWDQDNGWLCISCQEPGVPSAGDVDQTYPKIFPEGLGGQGHIGIPESNRHDISDDGSTVFFTARDALVPEDVNGEAGCPQERVNNQGGVLHTCQDLYEWHDGTVSLVSDGVSNNGVTMIGATSPGDTVFFVTKARLLGWDVDNGSDVYAAHVNGGYPEPPVEAAPCEGEACRVAGTVPPGGSGAGTAVFEGPGNPPSKSTRCPRGKKRNAKGRCVRSQRRRKAHKRQKQKAHATRRVER